MYHSVVSKEGPSHIELVIHRAGSQELDFLFVKHSESVMFAKNQS